MDKCQLMLGAVFEGETSSLMRVVAFDRDVVMYDTWWPHESAWSMAKLQRTISYYRLQRDYFETHSRYVRTEPLSEQELATHRPQLPFAVAQGSDLSWYEPWIDADGDGDTVLTSTTEPVLDTPAIYLEPFGPRDSAKPAVLVTADNGRFFAEAELLRKSKAIQDPFIGDVPLTAGVGIYRSGIRKRLPSYYIWGEKSRLDAPALNVPHRALKRHASQE